MGDAERLWRKTHELTLGDGTKVNVFLPGRVGSAYTLHDWFAGTPSWRYGGSGAKGKPVKPVDWTGPNDSHPVSVRKIGGGDEG